MQIEYVHKSMMNTARRCSQQLYYKDILKLKPDFVNESALAGNAFHKFAEEIYKPKSYKGELENRWDDWRYWVEFFINDLTARKEKYIADGIDINYVEDLKAEDFGEMIVEFLKQPFNRYAEPVLIEAPFVFFIKRDRKKYKFAGTIDQLLKIPIQHLNIWWQNPPPWDTVWNGFKNNYNKDYVYIHRDIKSGNRHQLSDIGLTVDDNINVYSYALAYGYFDLNGTGNYNKLVHHIPFAHALYFCRDHLKYKRKTAEHQVGDYKGKGMYFVKKDLTDIQNMENELINMHKKINSGIYTRDGAASNLCDRYCAFKNTCLHDWKSYG